MIRDNSISQITPTLYLTNCNSASNLAALQERNITRVISLGDSFEHTTCYTRHSAVEYLAIDIEDSMYVSIAEHFEPCSQYIATAPAAVLVHCYAGVSRSATIVIAHLMLHGKMSFAEAYEHVKARRATIRPNEGFLQELGEFNTKRDV